MKIEELMSHPAVTCHADEPMSCAARLMWEHDIGALPVVDGDERVVAVITDRDVCMAAWTTGKALHEIPVRVAMSHELFSCRPNESAQALARVMGEHRVRRVPIVDDEGRAVGIVSINDVARTTASLRPADRWGEARDLMLAISAICEHRAAPAAGEPVEVVVEAAEHEAMHAHA